MRFTFTFSFLRNPIDAWCLGKRTCSFCKAPHHFIDAAPSNGRFNFEKLRITRVHMRLLPVDSTFLLHQFLAPYGALAVLASSFLTKHDSLNISQSAVH